MLTRFFVTISLTYNFFQSVISMISVCLNEETTTTRLGGTSKDIYFHFHHSTTVSVALHALLSGTLEIPFMPTREKLATLKRVKTFPEIFFYLGEEKVIELFRI